MGEVMNDQHREAQDALGETIIGTFPKADPVERAKLIGAVELGQDVATFLQCEKADDDTWVDTGSDGHGYECFVRIKGREYQVYISPRSTEAEDAQDEREEAEVWSKWDLLCPRVIEALRKADPELAAEFEVHVTPKGGG